MISKIIIMKKIIPFILIVFSIFYIFSRSISFAEEEYIPEIPTIWQQITREIYDPDGTFEYKELKPSCSNFPGTSPDFYFFAKGGTDNKLVIYFEGGGACWFYNMVIMPVYNKELSMTTDTLDNGFGIFNLDNPKNPFKNWSIVYIPYCTGDLHIGAKDTTYNSFEIRHRGFVNFQAVLSWIKTNFNSPKQILVTGSSAGGFGTIWNFPFVEEAYPDSRIDFFADAGGIVFWAEDDFYDQKDNWDIQAAGVFQPIEFRTGDEQVELLLSNYPNSKGGIWGSAFDEKGAFFMNLVQNPDDPNKWFDIPTETWCEFHETALVQTTSVISPYYRYYLIDGITHTFLPRPDFYLENSGGIPLYRWLKAMVNNPLESKGQWQNLACPECLDYCE